MEVWNKKSKLWFWKAFNTFENQKTQKNNKNLDIKLEEAFKILGLNSHSDLKEVKTKYKHLAKKWHPDVQNDSKSKFNKDKFINITNAYKIILESFTKQVKT